MDDIPSIIKNPKEKGMKDEKVDEAIQIIHEVSGLTHNHLRSKIACGLYYNTYSIYHGNNRKVREMP